MFGDPNLRLRKSSKAQNESDVCLRRREDLKLFLLAVARNLLAEPCPSSLQTTAASYPHAILVTLVIQNVYNATCPTSFFTQSMRHRADRETFFRMRAQGYIMSDIATALAVHRSTLYRWLKSGPATPVRPRERPAIRKIQPTIAQAITARFAQKNTITLRQAVAWLLQNHNITISVMSMHRHCRRVGLTNKKGTKLYQEMNVERCQQFLAAIAQGFGPHILSLDEAAFCYNHVRGYAWAPKGSRAIVPRPGIRGKRHSLLLCISSAGVVRWQLYEGSVTAERFIDFLDHLPQDSHLVLDNAAIHKATNVLRRIGRPTVSEVANAKNITLKYLPPYAPKLNPTELCFNTIRTHVCRTEPRNAAQLHACVGEALQTLTSAVCDRTVKKVFEL